MALFPMFVDLTGQEVLILGTGHEAEEKAARLAPFGCAVRLMALEDFPGFAKPLPAMVILAERFHPANAALAAQCRELGIPVNAVDDPPLCSFQFGSMVCRDALTVGISTHGKAPALGQLVRRQVSELLPDRTEEILQWASDLTLRFRAEIPETARRGRLLRRLTAKALELGRPLTEAELAEETP